MKLFSPRAMYHTMGKKNFLEYILFGVFILFFYLPLLNLCMLAFANKYEVPAVIPAPSGPATISTVSPSQVKVRYGTALPSRAPSFPLLCRAENRCPRRRSRWRA